jgi:hypothetical protein
MRSKLGGMTPGWDVNQIAIAMNEAMEVNQVAVLGSHRFMIVRKLTRAEYDALRRSNAAIRARFGRRFEDHAGVVTGEDPAHLDPRTLTHPPEPPAECTYFYEAREL